ncbi:MAG TPA: translational GTPase TypA [Erysipelotrichaceae bacterium]|nr:translational GTPase TypA [Erysipelotrichaceae bacterium]
MQKIINIAVIAHVDAGKSTLVDAFISQSGLNEAHQDVVDRVMDSDDIEKERGITIYSKNLSVKYKDYKINIVDTPGHADFSSEVERIIKTVDTVILLVDAAEGPMPQTRFVLKKSLELGLRPILLINKIDKNDQRAHEVVDLVYELFLDLNATDEQLDFPILYGIARDGIAVRELEDEKVNIIPLFETIVDHVDAYPDLNDKPLKMQVSSLAYDNFTGRLGIGRIFEGKLKKGENIAIKRADGKIKKAKVGNLYIYEGLNRKSVEEAYSGDIVLVSGIDDLTIGDTLNNPDFIDPMEHIHIDEPTLSMNFLVNSSPLAGQSGKYITSRNIKDRLDKETEVNVGLKVEPLDTTDKFKVSGRGELHITILVENMRREGYELALSKPEVIFREIDGKRHEPIEEVVVETPSEYQGSIMTKLNLRKGQIEDMIENNGYTRMVWSVPTRGLIGYRGEFITDTRGEGTMIRKYKGYEPYRGEIRSRNHGVMISNTDGEAMTYSIFNLQEHGSFFISPQDQVYEGMIVAETTRDMDMEVNPTKNKKATAVRSSGADEAMRLVAPREITLEMAVEFIGDDELIEVTPDNIRLRKKLLKGFERKRVRNNK